MVTPDFHYALARVVGHLSAMAAEAEDDGLQAAVICNALTMSLADPAHAAAHRSILNAALRSDFDQTVAECDRYHREVGETTGDVWPNDF